MARKAFASSITSFQMNMANILMSMIFGGVLERYPRIRVVLGESGIGWIPYVLHRMDAEWEDQFKDLELTMAPSDYWRRQCFATYQTDPIGDQADRRSRRGPGHVGLGLPASRRHLARLARVRRQGARPPARRRAPQDRLRERRPPVQPADRQCNATTAAAGIGLAAAVRCDRSKRAGPSSDRGRRRCHSVACS